MSIYRKARRASKKRILGGTSGHVDVLDPLVNRVVFQAIVTAPPYRLTSAGGGHAVPVDIGTKEPREALVLARLPALRWVIEQLHIGDRVYVVGHHQVTMDNGLIGVMADAVISDAVPMLEFQPGTIVSYDGRR